jgi:hypothetical protein
LKRTLDPFEGSTPTIRVFHGLTLTFFLVWASRRLAVVDLSEYEVAKARVVAQFLGFRLLKKPFQMRSEISLLFENRKLNNFAFQIYQPI